MRHKLCQIIWHGKEPVFSVDFHRSGILASAGGDKDIKVGALADIFDCMLQLTLQAVLIA